MINKEKFNNLDDMSKLNYINKSVKETGKTTKQVCTLIGIALSTLSEKFKKMGYKFNRKSGQYVLQSIDGQLTMKLEPQVPEEQTKDAIAHNKTENVIAIINDTISAIESIDFTKLKKDRINTNIALNVDLKKQLQIHAIMNNITLADIINEAAATYLQNLK